MTALKKGFWSKAKSDEPLNQYIEPKFTHGSIPEDELFFIYTRHYAGKLQIRIKPFEKWPNDWLTLTASELAAII